MIPLELIPIAVIGLVVTTLIILKPYLGLVLFTSFLYLRPADLMPALAPFHITRLVAGITFLAVLFTKVIQKESILRKDSLTRLLTFLGLIILFSISTSIWRSNSLRQFINFFKIYIGFLLVINLINSEKRFRGIVWIMVLSGLFLGITSVVSYFQGENLAANYRVRAIVQGMFNNPNDLALCFLMLMPFVYFLFARSSSVFIKVFLTSSFVIFLLGIIFTYSRGGAIGLLGVSLFLFLRSKKKIRAAFALLLLFFCFVSFAPAKYIERVEAIPGSRQEDDAAISRIDAWKAGISMMTHRPLGVGIGNFGEGFVLHRAPDAIDLPGLRRAAHNAFIQIGGETGIPGLIVFLLLIIFALRNLNLVKNKLIQSRSKGAKEIAHLADATLISIVSFIICALFLSQAYNWIFYYLIGFSVILNEFAKRKSYEKPDKYNPSRS